MTENDESGGADGTMVQMHDSLWHSELISLLQLSNCSVSAGRTMLYYDETVVVAVNGGRRIS